MFLKFGIFILAALLCCDFALSVRVYSSFWEPLYNPKILNYRVDAKFDPDAGKNYRAMYEENFGYRGKKLIADLGNGKTNSVQNKEQNYGEVKFYYTYAGTNDNEIVK